MKFFEEKMCAVGRTNNGEEGTKQNKKNGIRNEKNKILLN